MSQRSANDPIAKLLSWGIPAFTVAVLLVMNLFLMASAGIHKACRALFACVSLVQIATSAWIVITVRHLYLSDGELKLWEWIVAVVSGTLWVGLVLCFALVGIFTRAIHVKHVDNAIGFFFHGPVGTDLIPLQPMDAENSAGGSGNEEPQSAPDANARMTDPPPYTANEPAESPLVEAGNQIVAPGATERSPRADLVPTKAAGAASDVDSSAHEA